MSALPEFESPEPKRLLNDEPLITRLVVDAVVNDPEVVDAYENRLTPVQVLVSERRVDDAAVPNDVSTHTNPAPFVFNVPTVDVESVSRPVVRFVVLAVANDE